MADDSSLCPEVDVPPARYLVSVEIPVEHGRDQTADWFGGTIALAVRHLLGAAPEEVVAIRVMADADEVPSVVASAWRVASDACAPGMVRRLRLRVEPAAG